MRRIGGPILTFIGILFAQGELLVCLASEHLAEREWHPKSRSVVECGSALPLWLRSQKSAGASKL